MAKKKIDTSKLSLGTKRNVKKTTSKTKKIDSDEVVKKIHPEKSTPKSPPAAPVQKESTKESSKRVTLDIPVSLHKRIKLHVFELETTMKKYFLELAEKDLGKK